MMSDLHKLDNTDLLIKAMELEERVKILEVELLKVAKELALYHKVQAI